MKNLLLVFTLVFPMLGSLTAFAQSSPSEVLENDFALIAGQYTGVANTASHKFDIKAAIRVDQTIVAGMPVLQPILTGVFHITDGSNGNASFDFVFNAGVYDSVSHVLAFHVPGEDAAYSVDVQCLRNADESLACEWPETSNSQGFKFTLIKNK